MVGTIFVFQGKPPPPGAPWPLPQVWDTYPEIVSVADKESFRYVLNHPNCSPLKWFTEKFDYDYLFGTATPDGQFPLLTTVVIQITSSNTLCEAFPKLGDDESCKLKTKLTSFAAFCC